MFIIKFKKRLYDPLSLSLCLCLCTLTCLFCLFLSSAIPPLFIYVNYEKTSASNDLFFNFKSFRRIKIFVYHIWHEKGGKARWAEQNNILRYNRKKGIEKWKRAINKNSSAFIQSYFFYGCSDYSGNGCFWPRQYLPLIMHLINIMNICFEHPAL